jgi:biopolymer transport protein ExbD
MRIPTFPRTARAGINMTPMIDVVFLLIIFFLVSSHLARQEVTMPVSLPVATSGESDPQSAQPRLTLTVQSDGSLHLAGRRLALDQLKASLIQAVGQYGADLEFRVRASREAPYRLVEPVMVAAAETGIWNLTFAVYERETGQ